MITNEELLYIKDKVHELYYGSDTNCARTTLRCLSDLMNVPIEPQTWIAAVGLHGAGGFRAQCGLVEGALMFIGIYHAYLGKTEADAVKSCYNYGEAFTKEFGSLRCCKLRPGGFNDDDPPHLCEGLTCKAIEFALEYMRKFDKRNMF